MKLVTLALLAGLWCQAAPPPPVVGPPPPNRTVECGLPCDGCRINTATGARLTLSRAVDIQYQNLRAGCCKITSTNAACVVFPPGLWAVKWTWAMGAKAPTYIVTSEPAI